MADDKISQAICEENHESSATIPVIIVDFDPHEHPHLWPSYPKYTILLTVTLPIFLMPLTSTIIAPALDAVEAEFHVTSDVKGSLTVSLFLLTYCLGPLTGVSTTGDIFPKEQRGLSLALPNMGPVLGSYLGPIARTNLRPSLRQDLPASQNLQPRHRQARIPPPTHDPRESARPPIGFFIYGWSAQYRTYWIVPDIGIVLPLIGATVIFQCTSAYLLEAYSVYGASANGGVYILRGLTGFGFPLFLSRYVSRAGIWMGE
ncbi:hypothetical protein ALUC_30817A [Aspergillus luchuensis]|nr:hypothetical protein ALUC_30817A [Aspergillus luchuensis]